MFLLIVIVVRTVNLTAVLRLFMRSDQGARRMKRARSSASPAAAAPQPARRSRSFGGMCGADPGSHKVSFNYRLAAVTRRVPINNAPTVPIHHPAIQIFRHKL